MSSPSESDWKVSPSHLPSIGTLHARAFHPASDWHRRNFPLSLAPWWAAKYALDIADPSCTVLQISSPASPSTVVGLISLHRYGPEERGGARWDAFPPPCGPGQADREAYWAGVKAMSEYRERVMLGREHFCVDHFGVDEEWQGKGVGGRLLGKACEVADREGLDMFVEANEGAESFYQRFGFRTEGKEEMPGGQTECFLVRRYGA